MGRGKSGQVEGKIWLAPGGRRAPPCGWAAQLGPVLARPSRPAPHRVRSRRCHGPREGSGRSTPAGAVQRVQCVCTRAGAPGWLPGSRRGCSLPLLAPSRALGQGTRTRELESSVRPALRADPARAGPALPPTRTPTAAPAPQNLKCRWNSAERPLLTLSLSLGGFPSPALRKRRPAAERRRGPCAAAQRAACVGQG